MPFLSMASALFSFGILNATQAFANQGLRGAPEDAPPFEVSSTPVEGIPRMLTADEDVIILEQSLAFKISMSAVLGLIALLQLGLIASFIHHRSKRVLEFAQPLAIGMMVGASLAITIACFLFIYISNIGCAIREPIIFVSVTVMGATIAGRAWRISALFNNPLMKIGRNGSTSSEISRVEKARQSVLHTLTVLTSFGCTRHRKIAGSSSIHLKITFAQLMQAITIMTIPSLLLQIVIVALSSSRSSMQLVTTEVYGLTVGVHECKSMAAGSWDMYASIIVASFPLAVAYLLNIRPKSELDELPEVVDERKSLEDSFAIGILVFVVTRPIISMSISPNVKVYATLAAILVLPLSMSYSIGLEKFLGSYISLQKNRKTSNNGNTKDSPLAAVKMAEMYMNIGRKEESIQLIDEILSTLKGALSSNVISNIGQKEGKEEIGAGFTRNDLKTFDHNSLDMVIHLLKLKARAYDTVNPKRSASVNIEALRIFENCPAASKLKDVSIIFPVYNWVGMLIKGGTIEQDDMCSLEVDLAKRYCHEAQVQAYHYARSLGSLAEMFARVGRYSEAFEYFNIMEKVYMNEVHPELLTKAYMVDRCALVFAMAALWEMKEERKDKAIERVNFVIKNILPNYDKKDIIGLFSIILYIIRVLKWNGHVDRAFKVYTKFLPFEAEHHFAVGVFYKPMLLLLKICDNSPVQYTKEDMDSDIELALQYDPHDFGDNIFTADGWSMKSMGAEICLHLASKLPPGDAVRESLVNKGLKMSAVANQRIKASNGSIKHILAFDAHVDIHARLLNLGKEDNVISRCVIYNQATKSKTEVTSRLSIMEKLDLNICGHSANLDGSHTSVKRGLSERLTVIDDESTSLSESAQNASEKRKCRRTSKGLSSSFRSSNHVSTRRDSQKKVAFSPLSSLDNESSDTSINDNALDHKDNKIRTNNDS